MKVMTLEAIIEESQEEIKVADEWYNKYHDQMKSLEV